LKPLLRGWLHTLAAPVALVAGVVLALRGHDTGERVGLSVYTFSLVALFGVSAAYHRLAWSPPAKARMRRADHTTIFLAIAGTYTAVASTVLHGWAAWCILAVVWVGAVGGIALRQCWMEAPTTVVAIPYVVVGWCAVIVLPQLERGLGPTGFGLLLGGGLCYSVGAVVYALRRPDPAPRVFGFHEVFHACTVAGATLQMVAVAGFALRAG
jgi:hemolysin III